MKRSPLAGRLTRTSGDERYASPQKNVSEADRDRRTWQRNARSAPHRGGRRDGAAVGRDLRRRFARDRPRRDPEARGRGGGHRRAARRYAARRGGAVCRGCAGRGARDRRVGDRGVVRRYRCRNSRWLPAVAALAYFGARPAYALLVRSVEAAGVRNAARESAGLPPARVRGALAGEPPHVAAAVISALPAATATAVLELYPPEERAQIVRRLGARGDRSRSASARSCCVLAADDVRFARRVADAMLAPRRPSTRSATADCRAARDVRLRALPMRRAARAPRVAERRRRALLADMPRSHAYRRDARATPTNRGARHARRIAASTTRRARRSCSNRRCWRERARRAARRAARDAARLTAVGTALLGARSRPRIALAGDPRNVARAVDAPVPPPHRTRGGDGAVLDGHSRARRSARVRPWCAHRNLRRVRARGSRRCSKRLSPGARPTRPSSRSSANAAAKRNAGCATSGARTTRHLRDERPHGGRTRARRGAGLRASRCVARARPARAARRRQPRARSRPPRATWRSRLASRVGRGGYPPSVVGPSGAAARVRRSDRRPGASPLVATVLSEGPLEHDPVADAARAALDGHVVLSARLAAAGWFPGRRSARQRQPDADRRRRPRAPGGGRGDCGRRSPRSRARATPVRSGSIRVGRPAARSRDRGGGPDCKVFAPAGGARGPGRNPHADDRNRR